MYERLIDLLKRELSLYSELMESASQKKIFIIDNDIEAIRCVTARENSLIGKLQRTERECRTLVSDISKHLCIPANDLTLAVLISRVNELSVQEQLNCLRVRLRAEMDKLKVLNEQNKALINHNLEYIEFTMNLIRSSVSGPVYAGAEEIHGQVFFDARG